MITSPASEASDSGFRRASNAFFDSLRERRRPEPNAELQRVVAAIRTVDALCDVLEELNMRDIERVPEPVGRHLLRLEEELPVTVGRLAVPLRSGSSCLDALDALYDIQAVLLAAKDRYAPKYFDEK